MIESIFILPVRTIEFDIKCGINTIREALSAQ